MSPRLRIVATLLAVLALVAILPTIAPAATLQATRRLSPPDTSVTTFFGSPSDSRAVFLASPPATALAEVYSTPFAGGTPQKLNAPLADGTGITALVVNQQGGRAFYIGQHASDSAVSLYSVPTSGGTPVALTGAQELGAEIEPFNLAATPSGDVALFRVRSRQFGPIPLYRVAATGGPAVKIDDDVEGFAVSPDGRYVLYRVDAGPAVLRTAPLDGSAAPLTLGTIASLSTFTVSPDSTRVVYRTINSSGQPSALVSQPVAGGDQTVLADDGAISFDITPNSASVVHAARVENGSNQIPTELRIVPIDGGSSTLLDQLVTTAMGRASFLVSLASGNRVVYVATAFASSSASTGDSELRSVPLAGGTPTLLLDLGSAFVNRAVLNADGSALAIGTSTGVYVGKTDGSAALVQVSSTTPRSGPQITTSGSAVFSNAGVLRLVSLDGQSNAPLALPDDAQAGALALFGDVGLVIGNVGGSSVLFAVDLSTTPSTPTPTPDPKPNRLYLPLLRN
jgi:hypothetical protein